MNGRVAARVGVVDIASMKMMNRSGIITFVLVMATLHIGTILAATIWNTGAEMATILDRCTTERMVIHVSGKKKKKKKKKKAGKKKRGLRNSSVVGNSQRMIWP
jgi:hypothetical protein